jgi:hypothetical protein
VTAVDLDAGRLDRRVLPGELAVAPHDHLAVAALAPVEVARDPRARSMRQVGRLPVAARAR